MKEALSSLEPATLTATVKEDSIILIAKNWRKQFQQVFHLKPKKEQPVTKLWQLAELFPSFKEDSDKQETLRISDCQYPGSRRPIRLLSSLLCLNSTHQHSIAIPFAGHILAALNGEAVDWPQEFHRELTGELIALNAKHHSNRVKVGKTSVGPHVTIILKAAGILSIREELEAGYRTSKALTIAEQIPQPKRKKAQAVKRPGPQPKAKERVAPHLEAADEPGSAEAPTAPVYIAMPQIEETGEAPPKKEVLLEPAEPGQIPKSLPPMIEQICQAHRHLENLLVSFTTKAPSRFVNQMNTEFFKVQREAILQQERPQPDDSQIKVLLEAQGAQLQHLATQLANSDSLNDLNIETIFQLEEQTASLEQKLYLSAETVLSLTAQKGEALGQLKSLQDKMAAQTEQLTNKDQEISDLNHHITDINGMLQRADRLVDNQKDTIMKLESRIDASQKELADLTSHTKKLEAEITAGAGEARLAQIKSASGSNPHTAPPIMSKEKHTLAAGIANRLLNDLRRELAHTQEEKADLFKTIVAEGRDFAQNNLPQSTKCDAAELYHQIWRHTEPLNSIMQYHRVCGGLNLLLSNIPMLKPGCFLDFAQIEGIWNHGGVTIGILETT